MIEPGNEKEEVKESGKSEDENEINEITNRQKRKNGFLENLENGVSVLKASKASGIAYVTIWRWRKADPEFDAKVTSIFDSRLMIVEDALFLNAAKGNLGAQIFWLKNRSQGRWKDRTEAEIDITHEGLDFEEFQNFKRMTEDERTAFIARLSEIVGSENVKIAGESKGSDKEGPVAIKEDNIPGL